jgi:anti-sigma28 factor (negative regulator of flagellin synthesis)
MIFPAASNRCLVPPIRMKKVLAIRQQLAEGRYDFDLRLNTVVDRLLNTLNA